MNELVPLAQPGTGDPGRGMAKKPKAAAKKKAVASAVAVRLCANIKSRKHPDIRCPLVATQGEFCTRHHKNPVRFQQKTLKADFLDTFSLTQESAVKRIQGAWRRFIQRHRWLTQGPAACVPSLADNETDITTMEPVDSIPLLYRWSYKDAKNHVWLFDIRALHMMRQQSQRDNPYTCEPFPESAETRFQERTEWLRKRKYCLTYMKDEELTQEQIWHQKILDMTMQYDRLGYYMRLDWIESMTEKQSSDMYLELWELWNYRLQLPPDQKRRVVPNWNKADTLLFKWLPSEIRFKRDTKWWQRVLVELLDRFVSAETKELRSCGALYGMTALAIANPVVRQHYSWLVQDPSGF